MLLAGRRRLAGLLEQGRSSSNRAKIRAGNPSAKKIIITRYGVFCITLIAAEKGSVLDIVILCPFLGSAFGCDTADD